MEDERLLLSEPVHAPEVVAEQREKLAESEAGKAKLQAALTRLDMVG